MRQFAPALLVLLLIAAILRIDFFFTVAYFLIAIALLSRVWLQRATRQLRVRREYANRAFSGDMLTVRLTVANDGWLPLPWLEVSETTPLALQSLPFQRQVVSLGPHATHTFTYTLACRRRGYYQLGPLAIHTGDLLGLERLDVTAEEDGRLTVYPRIVPLHELGLPTRSPLVALPARSPLFEDPSRLRGIRAYQRGDSPRRIHWPATARAGQLVVKQYQPAIARETLICLDLDQGRYGFYGRRAQDDAELAIVTAASLASHIVTHEKLPVGLTTVADDAATGERARVALPPRGERAHLLHLLDVLARLQVVTDEPFADLLRRQRAKLSWGATIAAITGRTDDELLETLLALGRGGFAVVLILVQPGRPAGVGHSGPDLPGVAVHYITTERDLEQWA